MKSMFDKDVIDKHLPETIQYRKSLYDLKELETYFIKKCKEKNIEVSHDCTAGESSYWKTLNYTTYLGMLIICPLSFNPSLWQMYDALIDNLESKGHIDLIKNNLKNKTQSKYISSNKEELKEINTKPFTHICILPGHNKFYFVSKAKIRKMVKEHGKNLIFKFHPVSPMKAFEENGFLNFIKSCQIAEKDSNMYSLIEKADTVYSTHISETALSSLIMGKTISPIDEYNVRMKGGFSHISHFCYTDKDPINTLSKIFASPKSGVIHPEVDKEWKNKIDLYLEYALQKRELQKGFYFYEPKRRS